MLLSSPLAQRLAPVRSVLCIGAGGGYDIFGALPLLQALEAAGVSVHLAGTSFTHLETLPGVERVGECPLLYAVTGDCALEDVYCPEAWLARWLAEHGRRPRPVWGLRGAGVRALRAAYQHLVSRLAIDTLVLVDGGIDLILRGDETSIGTPTEDLCSLGAARELAVPTRLIACIGLGAELRDGIRHAQVLERIAALTRDGGLLGSEALTSQSPAGRLYTEALDYVLAHQRSVHTSHVHRLVRAALAGEFGALGPDTWVSPLTAFFWFFELETVAAAHLFLPHLAGTDTSFEATAIIRGCRRTLAIRDPTEIPL